MNECEDTLVTTNELIYAAAYEIIKNLNVKPKIYNNKRKCLCGKIKQKKKSMK